MSDADFSVKAIISAQTSQFEKGIKNAQSSVNSLSSSISNITNLVKKAFAFTGVAIGTKAIVDFGKSCVQSANQAVKTFNILDNTVRATGADAWTSTKELESASKALSDSTNYSVTEIQKMQSVLLGFTNITGEAFDGASDAVLDMATVMGMDLTSAVQTVGKALDDPITGLDSLRRQGFKFTDEQKAELAQLVKNGKQLEAQKIILDELSRSYGGASKAGQDSFAQQRHAVENFQDTLGTKLIPTIKLFAQENAKAINSLRDSLDNIDFNQIGAVVVTSFNTLKNSIKNLSEPFKSVGENLKEFITNIDLKPFVSVLETLIGAFKKINEIRLDSGVKNIQNLKNIISGIGENIDINRIAEVINLVINGFVFLYNEVSKVFDTLQENIKTFVVNVWNSIKSIFEAGNKALADSEGDIKSWKDFVYNIFNSAFKVIQDLVNSVSAILKGDWKTAWNYMKLAVLRTLKSVTDSITAFVNAFPKPFQKIIDTINDIVDAINTAKRFFRIPGEELRKIDNLKPVNFTEKLGIDTAITETEKAIENATGDYKNKNLKDLEDFASGSKGALGKFVDNFKEATDQAKKELDALGQYTPPALSNPEQAEENASETYQIYSEWDSKLLEQRLENLNDWEKEYHEINLQLIEEERKKALEADKTGADAEKINKYYNKKIEKENERAEQAKRNMIKETALIAINQLKSIASNAVAIFKKVTSTIKNAFSGIVNIFTKIFEFNPDDALDNLLKIEDTILTFFVETLPKLPGFFSSAIESIIKLIDTLMNVIDWNQIANILNMIVDVFVKNAPTIVNNLLVIAENIIKTLLEALKNFVESGGWKMLLDLLLTIQKTIEQIVIDNMDDLVNTIIDMLPDLIETLKNSIVSASRTLGKLAPKILPMIAELINAIVEVITSDEVIDSANEAVEGIVEGLVEAIIKLLPNAIMKILNMAIKLANPQRVGKLVVAIVKGLVKAFQNINWLDVVVQCFMGFIDGFKELFGIHSPSTLFESFGQYIIEGLVNGLKGIAEAVNAILEPLYNLITNIFSGIGETITKTIDVSLQGLVSILESIGDIIKNLTDISFQGLNDIIGTVSDSLNDLTEISLSELVDILNWISDFTESTVTSAFEGLCDIIESSSSAFSEITYSVSDLVDSLAELIKQINNAMSALNPFGGGGSSGGGNSLPGSSSGTSVDDPWDWADPLHLIPGHARGSNAVSKGLALVGEAGPELVKFRGGEQVLNNRNTNKALANMGGKTNNFNVTFNNLQDTTAFSMMQQLKAYNRQMAINGIM